LAIPPSKRVQNFVSRGLQGGLLFDIARLWLIYHVLLWHGLFLLDVFVFHQSVSNAESLSFWSLYGQFCRQNVPLAICALVMTPWFFWKGLRLTHRVAGPLERFCDALNRLERGEPVKPLTLRRDDLLVEYQHAFNRYLASLQRDGESENREQTASEAAHHEAFPSSKGRADPVSPHNS